MKVRSKESKIRNKAKLTSKSQLTLPKAVREALGVRPGDAVVFEIRADGVRVAPDAEDRFATYAGRYAIGRGWSQERINAWLRQLRGHQA